MNIERGEKKRGRCWQVQRHCKKRKLREESKIVKMAKGKEGVCGAEETMQVMEAGKKKWNGGRKKDAEEEKG